MAPDVKSLSWQRSERAGSSRRRLSDMFGNDQKPEPPRKPSPSGPLREMRQFSLSKLKMPRASPTRRALRSSADKISKTFQQLRIHVDAFSQRLKGPTRRRRMLENVDTPVATPQTRSRKILGRTPTKMYSPFNIDSIDSNPGTPRRGRSRFLNPNYQEEENMKPPTQSQMTRSLVQTQAMVTQPSPTCKALLP